ncbi:metallophosphoesterase family protein [Brachyspira hyodysenteriae]|nr:metallophosphoesterase [Brachyspira hyodysenteriae]MCZ9893080.1 metallophosphoesterase family protein [Brachyspira hyodysenteriae]MCZ9990626.1 metallophosphoesterase family protein [Brachyspira hyodysenteriae]MCZ9998989.1 metallophosphoesterase family protein [Brachyspira hyodysenteriae]MDA0001702.1 metallophosphoesterase family protein [Brachyspira hyodysenteriae]MDA0007430.1 metallophosphoesterase family protein [Brachyspira hyodysenteriae]
MIYFISDTHFFYMHAGRKKIFNDYNAMHNCLINKWNEKIGKEDDVYIIGDFSNERGYLKTTELLKSLNGNKYLIKGNNDNFLDNNKFDRKLFKFIKDYYILDIKKYSTIIKKIVLFHYPILEWEGYYNNTMLIHGHWHKDKKYHRLAFNVACDIHDFSPLSINEILEMVLNE